MKVIIVRNKNEGGARAAKLVSDIIQNKKNCTLGLATGKTMIPFYRALISAAHTKKIDFSRVKTFNIDEFYGLNTPEKGSFRHFMDSHFFHRVNISKKNIHFLDGKKKDYKKECNEYERAIKHKEGIDIAIVGIGKNRHIGFNEPGSSFASRTRKVRLRDETRHANAWLFESFSRVPQYALTMGIETILASRKIILLAFGKEKATAVAATFKHVTQQVPASVLQRHTNVTFIIDRAAAKRVFK